MGKVHEISLPKRGIDIYDVIGDLHAKFLHRPSFNILIEHALLLPKKKRKLIINGDLCDISYGMKKNEDYQFWKKKAHNADKFFLPEWEEEAAIVNEILDELQMIYPEIIFLGGNHDEPRLWNIQEAVGTGYQHNFDLSQSLHLKKRGIPFFPYNAWVDIGKLSITHGQAHGATACKKHYEKSGGRSVLFNHVHQFEVKSFHARGDTVQTFSNPCMCELSADYLRNSETNWSNGFTRLCVKPNGRFNYVVYQIWNDELVLPNGKILRG